MKWANQMMFWAVLVVLLRVWPGLTNRIAPNHWAQPNRLGKIVGQPNGWAEPNHWANKKTWPNRWAQPNRWASICNFLLKVPIYLNCPGLLSIFGKGTQMSFFVLKVIFSQRRLAKTRQIPPKWKSSDVCVFSSGLCEPLDIFRKPDLSTRVKPQKAQTNNNQSSDVSGEVSEKRYNQVKTSLDDTKHERGPKKLNGQCYA